MKSVSITDVNVVTTGVSGQYRGLIHTIVIMKVPNRVVLQTA